MDAETSLKTLLAEIQPVDISLRDTLQQHLNDLAHPPGSLGRLEELALRYAMIRRTVPPIVGRKKIFIFAGDHGVTAEGVSAVPSSVTQVMAKTMLDGTAAITVLCRQANIETQVVDIGMAAALPDHPRLIQANIKRGTDNMARGPAMSRDEAARAILTGARLAREGAAQGITVFGTGEMGIGNTTPSSALYAALLRLDPAEVTGRGTGIDDAALQRKTDAIRRALTVNANRLDSPLGILAAVGGLEIAGICGMILGACAARCAVMVDGFISSAAALVAVSMNPDVKDYLFFGHCSAENGHRLFLRQFGARPLLDLDLRLGEGTGAALAIPLLESGVHLYNEMATFSGLGFSMK